MSWVLEFRCDECGAALACDYDGVQWRQEIYNEAVRQGWECCWEGEATCKACVRKRYARSSDGGREEGADQ